MSLSMQPQATAATASEGSVLLSASTLGWSSKTRSTRAAEEEIEKILSEFSIIGADADSRASLSRAAKLASNTPVGGSSHASSRGVPRVVDSSPDIEVVSESDEAEKTARAERELWTSLPGVFQASGANFSIKDIESVVKYMSSSKAQVSQLDYSRIWADRDVLCVAVPKHSRRFLEELVNMVWKSANDHGLTSLALYAPAVGTQQLVDAYLSEFIDLQDLETALEALYSGEEDQISLPLYASVMISLARRLGLNVICFGENGDDAVSRGNDPTTRRQAIAESLAIKLARGAHKKVLLLLTCDDALEIEASEPHGPSVIPSVSWILHQLYGVASSVVFLAGANQPASAEPETLLDVFNCASLALDLDEHEYSLELTLPYGARYLVHLPQAAS